MYVLRRATPEDALDVMYVNHRNLPEKYSLLYIRELLSKEPNASYVALFRGRVVGYVIAIVESRRFLTRRVAEGPIGHIVSVAVNPEHRRKNLARRMLIKALEDLRGLVDEVVLEVRVTNEPAVRLYSSLGFSIEQIRPGYYRDGEAGLIMTYRYARGGFIRSSRSGTSWVRLGPSS